MTKGLTARRGWGGGSKTFVNWANDNKVKKATFTRIRKFLKTLFQGAEESVSKEISASVLVPVWRRVSFKMASKVFIEEVDKVSNFSRIYCSDFLDLAMLRSLLSQKNRLWYLFGMKRPVVFWIWRIPFYRSANYPSIHIDRSHF